MRYQFSLSDWKEIPKLTNSLLRLWADRYTDAAGGKETATTSTEQNLLISNNITCVVTLDPTIPLLGIHPKDTSP